MLARVMSSAVLGIDAYLVEVEADISPQVPAFVTVGLPEGAVREARERVQSAIKNSDFLFPNKKVTINLAPADIRKEGSAFDRHTRCDRTGAARGFWGLCARW